MLPGTQFTAPPPTTPGEVGAGPRTPGEVTLGLLGATLELPTDDDPVIGCGVEPNVPVIGCGVEPNVPVIGAPVPGVLPMFGLLMPGAVLESMVGEVLNVPAPVIGVGLVAVPKLPVVPEGATGETAPGAAVWAKDTGAAAINAAATPGIKDFRLSMKLSFENAEGKAACRNRRAC